MRFPQDALDSLATGKIPDVRYSLKSRVRNLINDFMWSETIVFDYDGKAYSFRVVSSEQASVIMQDRFPDETMEIADVIKPLAAFKIEG